MYFFYIQTHNVLQILFLLFYHEIYVKKQQNYDYIKKLNTLFNSNLMSKSLFKVEIWIGFFFFLT